MSPGLDDWIAPLTEHLISFRLHKTVERESTCYDDESNIRFRNNSHRRAIITEVRYRYILL